jgi:hypothetical protein
MSKLKVNTFLIILNLFFDLFLPFMYEFQFICYLEFAKIVF